MNWEKIINIYFLVIIICDLFMKSREKLFGIFFLNRERNLIVLEMRSVYFLGIIIDFCLIIEKSELFDFGEIFNYK